MKFLTWLKSQSWMVTIGLMLAAVSLALAGAKSIKRNTAATRKENKAVDLMNRGIGADIKKAGRLVKSAEKDKQKAAQAKQTMQTKLEKLSEQNSDLDSVITAFNGSGRVRRSG